MQDPSTSKNESLEIQNVESSSKIDQDFEIWKEWKSFSKKLKGLFGYQTESNQLNFFGPYALLIIGIATLIITIKGYTTLIIVLGKIPLAPDIFEFIGAIWLAKFTINYLLRKQDREEFIYQVTSRWKTFLDG